MKKMNLIFLCGLYVPLIWAMEMKDLEKELTEIESEEKQSMLETQSNDQDTYAEDLFERYHSDSKSPYFSYVRFIQQETELLTTNYPIFDISEDQKDVTPCSSTDLANPAHLKMYNAVLKTVINSNIKQANFILLAPIATHLNCKNIEKLRDFNNFINRTQQRENDPTINVISESLHLYVEFLDSLVQIKKEINKDKNQE